MTAAGGRRGSVPSRMPLTQKKKHFRGVLVASGVPAWLHRGLEAIGSARIPWQGAAGVASTKLAANH